MDIDNRKKTSEEEICALAKQIGFQNAAFMNVDELVFKPEYRKYCEMNLCHQYDLNPSCPPSCGTVEELKEKSMKFRRVLVLQTVTDSNLIEDSAAAKKAKADNNRMADELLEKLPEDWKGEILRMSAGPWRGNSCMSAYCVDAQCMADSVHMDCWVNDGKGRFFSQILFH